MISVLVKGKIECFHECSVVQQIGITVKDYPRITNPPINFLHDELLKMEILAIITARNSWLKTYD